MPDKYPRFMSILPYNFVVSNVNIHWQTDSFKKIEEWIEKGCSYEYILNPIEIDKGLYIISSILHNRKIRIISYKEVFYNNSDIIYCSFKGSISYFSKIKIINYPAVHEKYCNLFCDIPSLSNNNNNVYISNKRLSLFSIYTSNKKYSLLFCLTTLFNYNNSYRFLEFIEYYRYFGVDKFVVYNTNCSKKIKNILLYYSKLGLIDIVQDNLTHNLYEKKRFHVWKQNDCLFRYKYNAKRIIFTDHDEIIYSPIYGSNNIFLHINNKAAIFHFYPKLIITKGEGFFIKGNYSICPNMNWKFIINKSNCVSQVVVHDVILKSDSKCFKETVPIEKGYVLHARNEESRHSKLCRKWNYENENKIERNILIRRVRNINYQMKKNYLIKTVLI